MRDSIPRGVKRRLGAICAIALSTLMIACGGKPPELAAVEWRLEKRPAKAGDFESLSVFATIKDDDGIEDIVSFWVINDAEALAWNFTNANWTKKTEGNDTWFGAAGLAKNDYAPFPRGEYRFMAIDQAGERTEKSFRIEGNFPDTAAPVPGFSGGMMTAASAWPETLILAYDATGALITSIPIPEGGLDAATPADILGSSASGSVEFAVYGYDPARRMGAYSWKQKIR